MNDGAIIQNKKEGLEEIQEVSEQIIEKVPTEEVPYEIKVAILLKAFEHTQTSISSRFSRAQNINTWIGSVFVIVIGGSAIFGSSNLASFGINLRVGITIAICSLFAFAWVTEVLIFKAQVKDGESALKINQLLHLSESGFFDEETVIFEEDVWGNWLNNPIRHLGISPGTAILFILSIVAIMTIWSQ